MLDKEKKMFITFTTNEGMVRRVNLNKVNSITTNTNTGTMSFKFDNDSIVLLSTDEDGSCKDFWNVSSATFNDIEAQLSRLI